VLKLTEIGTVQLSFSVAIVASIFVLFWLGMDQGKRISNHKIE
jgi:hypothetical protein